MVSISNAILRVTLRVSATMGVEQNSPMFTPFTPNRASSLATARSQVATSWQPAAVASPCTCAINGCGRDWMRVISAAQRSNRVLRPAAPLSGPARRSRNSFRS